MITKPLKVLVCLAIAMAMVLPSGAWGYDDLSLISSPGLKADALSAETALEPIAPPTRSYSPSPNYNPEAPAARSFPRYRGRTPVRRPMPRSPFDFFKVPGFGFSPFCNGVTLPNVGLKRFQLSARLWNAKLNSSTIIWGTDATGNPGTELDLHRHLELNKYELIPEYEGRCQIRCNWALSYSFMPIRYEQVSINDGPGFWYGNVLYATNTTISARWHRNIHRWGLEYNWFRAPHCVSSLFGGYSLYDDKLSVATNTPPGQTRHRARNFGLAFAGISIERASRPLAGGIASVDFKWAMQFLEGYFGYDGHLMGRLSVPMGGGRWGYMEVGWRWMVLERSYPSDTDETSMDGLMGSVGMVF